MHLIKYSVECVQFLCGGGEGVGSCLEEIELKVRGTSSHGDVKYTECEHHPPTLSRFFSTLTTGPMLF